MKRQHTCTTDLICSECGNVMTIARKECKRRSKYHIKDMFCVYCNKISKFIEVHDVDIYKKELEFKNEKNYSEELLNDIIKGVNYFKLEGGIDDLRKTPKSKIKRKR